MEARVDHMSYGKRYNVTLSGLVLVLGFPIWASKRRIYASQTQQNIPTTASGLKVSHRPSKPLDECEKLLIAACSSSEMVTEKKEKKSTYIYGYV